MLAYGELLRQDGIELEFIQPTEQVPVIPATRRGSSRSF
jgi:hypothetical protein